jgi:hypothetical protein
MVRRRLGSVVCQGKQKEEVVIVASAMVIASRSETESHVRRFLPSGTFGGKKGVHSGRA